MYGKFILLLIAAFAIEAQPLKAPAYFKKCARKDPNFNTCAKASGQEALKAILPGDKKYKIPNLTPLHIPLLKMDQGQNLKIILTDSYIDGLSGVQIEKIEGDFNQRRIKIWFSAPQLSMKSQYEMNGKILVLPIQGKGPSNMVLENLKFTYDYSFDIVNKNGVDYLSPKKGKIDYDLGGLKLRFDNLFNGDKLLGEETNNFLNENWKEVAKELGPDLVDALAEVVYLVLRNFCELVPYEELFPETV